MRNLNLKKRKVLVTGAGGFLGHALCRTLAQEGALVTAVDLERSSLTSLEPNVAEIIDGDLRDQERMLDLCADQELVFNTAAIVAAWGKRDLFWSVNVDGTNNLIEACRHGTVRRLVHVSSPSAIFDGSDHFDVDETAPYPKKFLNYYCETKAVSEQNVLAANCETIETVAVRPHAIWGPGDRHLLPRIVKQAKAGRLAKIGDGKNVISTVYVDNAVDAMLKAATSINAPGNVYFVTDGVPVKAWDFVNRILGMLNLPEVKREIPFFMADAMATAMEFGWNLFSVADEPVITRYKVAELARNHTYSIKKAQRDLGYEPIISIDEGLKRTAAWANEQSFVKID